MVAASLALCALATSCGTTPLLRFEFTETHMGAPCRIVVYAADEPTARSATTDAFGRIGELAATLSDYEPTSELSRLPSVATAAPHRAGADLFDLLARAQTLSEATDGAFDPTLGPLVRLWRRARRLRELPTPERMAAARAQTGMQYIEIDRERRTIHLRRPLMQLDVGGIAKGYAADQALDILRARGLDRALVDLGGDMALGSAPPDRAGWTVRAIPLGTDDPDPLFLILADVGVATSGDSQRGTEIDGVRYSHIVDPRTGIGVTSGIGVTVIAPDATTADALASAVSVLGENGIDTLLPRFPGVGIAARFRDRRTRTAGSIEGF